MIELIVLGTIPGTAFQINFYDWLIAVAAVGNVFFIGYLWHVRRTGKPANLPVTE